MADTLLDTIIRYSWAHANESGGARTPIPGITILRATCPSELEYAISKPLVAMVVQGGKRVSIGSRTFDFGVGDSLLITADVPTISQITRANLSVPYFSIVVDLDHAVIKELALEMEPYARSNVEAVSVDPTDSEVADAALRLMRLLDRPQSVPVLQAQLVRELHYWLLAGRHGAAIRNLGIADSHSQRVARAIAVIRSDYAQPLRVEHLAEVAGMSPSSFHQHFRAITSFTPLQFQKQLRLIEARRILLSKGTTTRDAAYAVGYESVHQFTREYGRMFGLPPARDRKLMSGGLEVAA